MWFKLFYTLFFIAQLFYGEIYIGAFTPRQLMGILMFIYCALSGNLRFDKYVILYIVFILFFGFSSWLSGYYVPFIRQVAGFYFVAYVGYCATRLLIEKHDGANWLLNTIIIVGIINSLVTIGQYFSSPYPSYIKNMLGISQNDFYVEIEEDELSGFALPGLFPHAVVNGYFCCIATIAVLWNATDKLKFHTILLWSISIVATFCVQQRMAFGVALLLSIYLIYKKIQSSKSAIKYIGIIFFSIALIYGLLLLESFIQSGNTRYTLGMDDSGRSSLFKSSWAYLTEHPIWGGFYDYSSVGFKAHNIFLNAFLYGGLFGGLAILVLFFMQLKICVKSLNKRGIKKSNLLIIYSMMVIALALNSILHNASIVTGDVNTWILFGAVNAISTINEKDNETYRVI